MQYEEIKVISKGRCCYCKKPIVEHIIKEGARYHVLAWDSNGDHCSEPNCERNHGIGKCVPEPIFEVKCSLCGHLFTATGMKDTSCPECGATVYDKDPNFDKWRNVPAIRVVGVVK